MFFLTMLSTVLFFFCLYLYLETQIIKKKLTKLELENKTILERKIFNNKEDSISIENISTSIPKEAEKNTSKEQPNIIKKEDVEDSVIEKPKPYIAKNNFEENNQPKFSLPTDQPLKEEAISKSTQEELKEEQIANIKVEPKSKTNEMNPIAKNEIVTPTETLQEIQPIPNVTLATNFEPSEFIKNNISTVQKNVAISNKVENEYLQELSTQLKEEIPPQTIELTGYEKIQEEQAIISYQELLSLKEKIKNQDKQDENFIETLKELRNLLD